MEYQKCSHTQVQAEPESICAIGFANGAETNLSARLICWTSSNVPQGIRKVPGLCAPCRFRLEKYGTTDPAISLQKLAEINVGARKEAKPISGSDNPSSKNK